METYFGIMWIVSIIAGTIIGSKKGEGCISFLMCCLLGPIWLIVVLVSQGNRVRCPYCREFIDRKAIICSHCRSELRTNFKM